ncbi:MAG: GNAT family N-acetyltransferase [Phycisphaerales bacterium]|nr:GNAT family N-acetyltransferase [Phycisphaerales bacterium]
MSGPGSTPSGGPVSVSIRPVARADLPVLFEIQLDPEGNRLAGVVPRDRAAFEAALERAMSDPAFTARAVFADGVLVGSMARFPRDGRDFVGYWIAREHWGRGIATRAVALLLAEVPTRPLYARVARHNAASLRVLEKCGFAVAEYRWLPASERELACEVAVLVLK